MNALENLRLDVELWEKSRAAIHEIHFGDRKAALASTRPRGWRDIVRATSSDVMRANALTLAHYLEHGLALAPSTEMLPPGEVHGLFHHGDLIVDGDLTVLRDGGKAIACVVTGSLRIQGALSVPAFDGELMVGGNVDCARLECDAEIGIGRTICCRYARLGWYDCTSAFGTLDVEFLIDHQMIADGTVNAKATIACEDHDESLPESQRAQIEKLAPALRKAVVDEPDPDAAYQALDAAACAAVAGGTALLA